MKLTQEQADAILQAMAQKRNESYWNALIGPNEFQFMQKIIDDCIEKKFPEFKVNHDEVCTTIVRVANPADWGEDTIEVVRVDSQTLDECSHFYSFVEFKQLTLACQKIVNWIKGQE